MRKIMFYFLALGLLSMPATSNVPTSPIGGSAAAVSVNDTELSVFALINESRLRSRLLPLEWDSEAARLARSYSARMAREDFFDHIDPDGNSVVERAERIGLRRWHSIGENLFKSIGVLDLSRTAVNGWMRSPSHRKNLLGREWSATGIGVAYGRGGRVYITQIFIGR